MSKQKQTDIEKMTFEQAFSELEAAVQKLESGSLPLAEAIALYERGMTLAQHCHVQLDQAELSIKTLTPAGELVDFDEV
ncbi:MAG: exodeoxyribonuclease VII small subunit [Chloroflexota bacterium]